ncbi:hypothetical protein Mal64_03040 [Pseudobythopirellula maris]|uniref:Competence protein A n=1 Tax=Pseudobythopirellula maris TaxID=2527991 RepID=A0A5C5ZQU2_9BACT|nr:PilN domain-containing protein [Pseudobythopirellula maris]TWT89922.1 hypothetical protein Mal64_03040 [Pseudobythopirellula maris]
MPNTPPKDRRQSPDRRDDRARRKHSESRVLCIEVCRSTLKAVIVTRQEKSGAFHVETSTKVWRHEATRLGTELGSRELTVALKEFVAEGRLAGCRAAFTLNCDACVTRSTSGAKQVVEQELTSLGERSQLYLSLGPGPKALSVHRTPIDARHEHGLVTVANEQTVSSLATAAEAAGLRLEVVESSIVSVARLLDRMGVATDAPTAMVILDEDRFDLGVCYQGIPLLEVRPTAAATAEEFGPVVSDYHKRLLRYCNRLHGLGSAKLDKLLLIGQRDEVESATRSLDDQSAKFETEGFEIGDLGPDWQVDPESLDSEMTGALGLALRCSEPSAQRNGPNLMEDYLARVKTPLMPIVLRALSPVGAVLAASLALALWNAGLRTEVDQLDSEYLRLRPVQLESMALGKSLRSTESMQENLAQLGDALPRPSLFTVMTRVRQCLPSDVWINHFALSDYERVDLRGDSYTEGGVYDFVSYLGKAPGVSETALKATGAGQSPQGPTTSFDVQFDLTTTKAFASPPEKSRG